MEINKKIDVEFTVTEFILMALCWYGWAEFGWHIAFPIITTAAVGLKLIFTIAMVVYMAIQSKR